MYSFVSQCDIMSIVRKEWKNISSSSLPLGFSMPETSQTEPMAKVNHVSSRAISSIHFQETITFKVWASGNNARRICFEEASKMYEAMMDLWKDPDNFVTGTESISAVLVDIDPILEIPFAQFTIAFTTTNERRRTIN